MKSEKKPNHFLRILFILFLIYTGLFIAEKTGYYDKSVREKTYLTETKIKEFEKDIALGKDISPNDYFPKEEDYSNAFTKSANFIENKLSVLLDSKAKNMWEYIRALFIS